MLLESLEQTLLNWTQVSDFKNYYYIA